MTGVIYRFAAVTVDDQNLVVRVDGERRPTEPQVIAVLTYLIENRHRVVSKDELLEEVWGTQFVSAAAVTSRIKSARQAIGDTGRAQTMIRTVHGRGYRFVAEVAETDDPVTSAAEPAPSSAAPAGAPSAPTSRELDAGWPLVGRQHERDRTVDAAVAGDLGGLLFTGPAGLGKTRLARAIVEEAEGRGLATARIHGHPGVASVPLGAIAHLLPDDIAEISDVQGEMARAVLLQRARAAIKEFAGDGRLVLMVDDIDRVDSLSQALLASLIADRTVFAVLTQRVTADETLAFEHLIRSGDIEQALLATVPDDQMIALLGRVLDGPVQPMTSEAIVAASDGLPGVMRQLIEGGLSNGTLGLRDGVWRLSGGVTPPGDMAAAVGQRLDNLEDEQRDALELIAIAGDLDLDMAFDLINDEVLDQLELDGMISVRKVGTSTRLRLSHPLYGEILLEGVTPLRDRRHRSLLATQLSQHANANAADRLHLVRLQLDGGTDVDSTLLIDSAVLALIENDTTLALRLLRSVPEPDRTSRHQQLLGEVLYMRGRFDDAYDVWSEVDLEAADEEVGSGVLRRISTWNFYGKWRFVEAIERLDREMQRYSGTQRMLLESYWCELAALDGQRADEVFERSERLVDGSEGHARCDFLSAAAMASFVRGRYDRAIELIRECNDESSNTARTIHWVNSAYVDFVEILTHVELGNIADGWATFERITEPGAAPDFGFASTAAGRLALASGHWQQGLDWLEPKIQITEALGITTNGRPLQAQAAVCALMLGQNDTATEMAGLMRSDMPDRVNITTLDMRWAAARVEAALGDRDRALSELATAADDARRFELHYMEALMLSALSHLGRASDAVERLAELTELIDGDFIGLRHEAAVAIAEQGDVGAVLDRLDERDLVFEATCIRNAVGLAMP